MGQPLQPCSPSTKPGSVLHSPAQHAVFLEYVSQLNIELDSDTAMQMNFNIMYSLMYDLFNQFYPEREIPVTSSAPHYVTPPVKAMLRRKNRLTWAGWTDEADALTGRIRAVITRSSSKWLRKVDTSKSPKYAWMKVGEVLRSTWKNCYKQVDGMTAQVMNDHYAAISTDSDYHAPDSKHTARERADNFVTAMEVFRILDTLRPTATGLDAIAAWFLRLGAPVFAAPIA